MKNIYGGLATLVLAVAVAAPASAVAQTVDINMAGWTVAGSVDNAANSRAVVDIGALSTVTGFEFIGLSFTAAADSWLQDLVLTATVPTTNFSTSPYMDFAPAAAANSGSFGPISGAWGGASGLSTGASFSVADGLLLLTAYSSFVPGASETVSLTINAGTLRVNVTPIPEPSTYALMALGLVGLGLWARRQQAAR